MKHSIRKVLTSKFLLLSVAALLFYTFSGFILAPWIIRWYVPKYVQENLHCLAVIDKVRINPFLLTVEVDRFSLQQADGSPLVAFERFFLDLETSSLFQGAVVLRQLDLDKPEIHLVVEPDGSNNFDKLAARPAQTPEPKKSAAKFLPFILQSAVVREGQMALVDKRQNIPAEFALHGLNLNLQDVSTVKEHKGTYRLATTTEDGGSVQWEGEITLSPLRTKGKLALNTIRIASLWKFFRDNTNLEQPAGTINASSEYQVNADTSPLQLVLEGLHLSLTDLSLRLRDTDKAFLHLKNLDLEAPHFELATKELHVRRLLFAEGAVDAQINDAGEINLQKIVRESLPVKQPGEETPPSSTSAGAEQKTADPPAAADMPFRVQADAILVKNIAINLDEKSRKTPINAAIAGGDLKLQANLQIGAAENKIVLQEISSELRGISLHSSQSPEPLFATEKLTFDGGECDLGAHSIIFGRIAMSTGRLDAALDAEGRINWQQLLQAKGAVEKSTEAKPAPNLPEWKFLVKAFEVEGFSSKFSDLTTHSPQPLLSLQGVKVRLTEIDGKSPMGFAVGFQLQQGGTATVSGTVNPATLAVQADINASGLVLTSLQPYLEPYVTLKLQSASASARGHLRYGIPGAAQKVAYEGGFSLNNLRLADPRAPKPYLRWDAVQLPKFKLTLQPNGLEAQEIKIVGPVGEFIIGEDKTLNFAKIFKNKPGGGKASPSKQAAKNAAPKKEQATFPYHIAKVRVENGNVLFADLSLRPRFMTRIHGLKGTVTGLSSLKDSQTKIQMDGYVDQYGIAKINGAIRPGDFGRSSDIEMIFRNLELKNLSPYSGKFAGRLIKSGKISADLKYTLQDYKMTGDNKIVIDNLFLGEQVDNPDATNLPLDLAIALLKDANGRIEIGLPVTGDLNDPHFSIGPLIWKMFTNLITKAVTSPFRALGHLLGGESESFQAVEFDPASAVLLPPEKEKLLKLADALKSRPQLKLVIQGRYSPEVDGRELQDRSMRAMVTSRLGAKLGPNDIPDPLDFADSKTQDTVEKLYTERFGKASLGELEKGLAAGTLKPRIPALPQEETSKKAGKFYRAGELYSRLVESEKVADTTFLQLAENRAQSIVGNLEGEAGIAKDRVSVKPPEPFSGKEHPAVTLSLDGPLVDLFIN